MASQLTYPVKIQARLDDDLSRWLWLVKWLLAIPHYLVLVFLWTAFFLMSVVAFFSILFTGRYPRAIFDFNVGVLRWSWRVSYYSYGALATDRYPPFTLREVPDYPVHLDIDYPEKLSRGLVLIKWWLLAIPHYIIVALLMGGAWVTVRDWEAAGFGLIGILTLVAGVALAFTGRYPNGLFDLLLGLNRWVIRVAAYAGLMTDSYPPFRLDMGGNEPGTTISPDLTPPTSPTPTSDTAPRGWTAGPILALVSGSLIALMSLGLLLGGGVGLWADTTQREGGFVTSPTNEFSTAAYAVVSDDIEIQAEGPNWVLPERVLGDVRVRVSGAEPLFVGVGPTADVERYLSRVAVASMPDFGWTDGIDLPAGSGGAPTEPPGEQSFWLAADGSADGASIAWPVSDGTWTVVVMNADGSRGVAFEGDVGAEAPALTAIAIGLLIAGVVLAIIAIGLIAGAVSRARRRSSGPVAEGA